MDLKTYAVLEKLKSNSALLDHMVKHETISIDQASDFFKPLLDKEENKEIKLLVDDYPKYLATHVKLHIEQLANNELQVDGEINDQLLSTISLLSGDDNQKIVENAIKYNLTSFSDQDVKLDNLEMSDSGQDAVSNQLPSLTMTAVENAEESDSQQQADNQEHDKDQEHDDQKSTDDQEHVDDQKQIDKDQEHDDQKQIDKDQEHDDQKSTDNDQEHDDQKSTDEDQEHDDQKSTDEDQKHDDQEHDDQEHDDQKHDDQKHDDQEHDDQKHDDQKQTVDNGAITAQGANAESASEKNTDSKTPHEKNTDSKTLQLAYDRKVAKTLHDAMQFLLSEIKKYKLDEDLPNINTKALMI